MKQANDIQDDKLVFMCTGSQGEPMAALGRIADGNRNSLCTHHIFLVGTSRHFQIL